MICVVECDDLVLGSGRASAMRGWLGVKVAVARQQERAITNHLEVSHYV